jgi:hypothetical protein
MLNLAIVVYLLAYALLTAVIDYGFIGQLVFVPILVGIKESASTLADPFGDDVADLPLSELLLRNLMMSRAVFEQAPDSTFFIDYPDEVQPTGWLTGEQDTSNSEALNKGNFGLHNDVSKHTDTPIHSLVSSRIVSAHRLSQNLC